MFKFYKMIHLNTRYNSQYAQVIYLSVQVHKLQYFFCWLRVLNIKTKYGVTTDQDWITENGL